MTTEPKEINKIADKVTNKKPTKKKPKSIGDLNVVKKKLATNEKKLTAMHKALKTLVQATGTFQKILLVSTPKRKAR